MSSFKNNRVVLAVFAILMVIGLMAAYIPMLFPPSAVPDATVLNDTNAADTNDYAAQLPSNPVSAATTTVATSTTSTKASLPDSFSGLQDELQGILNK